jgi:hypothetical protein
MAILISIFLSGCNTHSLFQRSHFRCAFYFQFLHLYAFSASAEFHPDVFLSKKKSLWGHISKKETVMLWDTQSINATSQNKKAPQRTNEIKSFCGIYSYSNSLMEFWFLQYPVSVGDLYCEICNLICHCKWRLLSIRHELV